MAKSTQTQVRRMEPWEVDEAPQLPAVRKRDNFVAPLPPPVSSTITALRSEAHELQPVSTVQEIVQYTATPVDRANAFHIRAVPLAIAFGFVAFLLAVLLFGNPWLSAPALLSAFIVFALTWGVMSILDGAQSPDGIALTQTLGGLHMLRREQDFRHERIRHHEGMPRKGRR